MATWTVQATSTGALTLTYRNRITGRVHACGTLRKGTPPSRIVDWVVRTGDAAPGDIILLTNGWQLQVLSSASA